jgi:prepilin peptidase CpaA
MTCLITDIKTSIIKNYVCIVFAVFGLILNILNPIDSIVAISMPIALLYILFKFNVLGGGDIKLFAAIGAINGLAFVFACMLYSFVFGGVIGFIFFVIMKFRKHDLKIRNVKIIFTPAILLGAIYVYVCGFQIF